MHEDKFLVQSSRVYPVIAYYQKTINKGKAKATNKYLLGDQS